MDHVNELDALRREVAALRDRIDELENRDSMDALVSASERELLLREAERITNTGSWVWDPSTGRVFWSEQMYRMLGYDPNVTPDAEMFYARVHPDDLPSTLERAERTLATGEVTPTDVRIVVPGRDVRWGTLDGSVSFDDDGSIHRIVGTFRDTTEDRRDAVALAEAHRLEAVGELAGGVAHDFRNLLMVIRTQLELLDDIDPTARSAIQTAVDRASSVTAQLLAFGQQVRLRTETEDFNGIIASVVERVSASEPRLTLQLKLASSELPAAVDRKHLSEALENVLLYFGDQSSRPATIRVSTQRDDEHVVAVIEDDETQFTNDERIFEPFFQTTGASHVDLRMAMAHGIVVQHGGYITFEQSPTGGVRFTLRLKLADPSVRAPRSEGSATTGDTILVVDDQAPVARVVSRLLQSEGFTVLVADHPHRALQMYEEHADEIDIVLTDLAMPDMMGTQLIEELGRRWSVRHVIFMSGYAAEAEHQIDPRYPLLHKPFTRDQLLSAIKQLKA